MGEAGRTPSVAGDLADVVPLHCGCVPRTILDGHVTIKSYFHSNPVLIAALIANNTVRGNVTRINFQKHVVVILTRLP